MWGSAVDGDALRRTDTSAQRNQPNPHHGERAAAYSDAASSNPSMNNEHEQPDGQDAGSDEEKKMGTWGEQDTGRFNEKDAKREYEILRSEYRQLHKTLSSESKGTASNTREHRRSASRVSRKKTWTGQSQRSASRVTSAGDQSTLDNEPKEEENAQAGDDDEDSDFELSDFIREGHFEKRNAQGSRKKVGVIYENLTVRGVDAGSAIVKTVPDAILGTFGPDLYRLLSKFLPFLQLRKPPTRALINDFTGCVRDGEMMLVLGRPGSGCSTFLKAISNNRASFAAVEGEVSYGSIAAADQLKKYRGEANYNPEEDNHFAALTVWQTLSFALMNKTKKADLDDIPITVRALMKMFGISHTKHTLVGDDLTRGVSGGERKRVSIAETLASKSSIIAWDNSTRGLDASTALDYARSLRIMTDISNRTTFVTLYQAGEGIYEVMDKVMVIEQGRQIFSGPASRAKQYFIDLGFECPERQTTADFLTAVGDPAERRFRPGFEQKAPKTAEDLEKAFRASPDYQALLDDVKEYKTNLETTNNAAVNDFIGAVQESKSRTVSNSSPYTVSFFRQVLACTKRQAWLLAGDTASLYTKLFIIVSMGLVIGSLFYGQSTDTRGAFSRGGTLFLSILFLGWLQLSELMAAVSGRGVVSRHHEYAFYRPSAVSLARAILDIPIVAVQVCIFGIIMYFLPGLDAEAGKFFIFLLFVYITTIMLTALYRMFASLSPDIDTAVRFSGIAFNLLIVFAGYVIPKPQLLMQKIWFGWLYWINPIAYSFESVLSNELSSRNMECAPTSLFPQGQNVDPQYQGCAAAGASIGSDSVSGADYLATTYDYSKSNIWRNFGVLIAFTVLYLVITVIMTETVSFVQAGGGVLVFKGSRKVKKQIQQSSKPKDEEAAVENSNPVGVTSSGSSETRVVQSDKEAPQEEDRVFRQLAKSDSIFTWRDIEYSVPYLGGQRKLLNKVSGYAKPGVMVALMGVSGAGKTTLLNTLSQRQSVGVVSGEMFVDGRPLNQEFQRNTGFCLQGDIHDTTQTVREALDFSAILRQEASVSRADKLAYVDKIMDLLELNDLADALILSLGVEQRKRLTIGVELVAKPSLLLFLDEPTSGLDSQGAYSIVRFLRRLCQSGQAIICTIHQPSSVLIQQFDMILALNPGGNTFYFGPMGANAEHVIKYFADRGAVCPPGKNVAEFILETAAKPHRLPDGTKINWNREWRESEEAQLVLEEIDGLKKTRSHATQASHAGKADEKTLSFAASPITQSVELTKRMLRQYWRDSSYIYGQLFTAVIMGIFNGFTFWQLGHTVQDLQNSLFTSFVIVTIPATIVNGVLPKFYGNMSIWEAREHPSRIYGWFAFCTANVLAEIPGALFAGFLYWVLWYWATGLPTESSVSGYTFIMTVLMFCFMNSWGQWIAAFAPSFTVISNVLPFFFVMFCLFNGVVQPYESMPVFWRYFVYYANPCTYWIGGILAATLDGTPVQCAMEETARFNPPPDMTCQEYAGQYLSNVPGYLVNGNATSNCQYCPFTTGNDYLATLNVRPEDKWRNFGIFLAFCISNWALVYFFIFTVRVRGWSFGFGTVFGGLGKALEAVKKLLPRKKSEKTEE